MPAPSLAGMHAALRAADLDGLPKLDIAVLRNVTVEPLEVHLRYGAYRAGLDARVHFGEYDSILQEASHPDALVWRSDPSVVLVFAKLEVLAPALTFRFPSLGPDEIESEVRRVTDFVDATLRGLAQRQLAAVLWLGFETPLEPALGIYDSQIRSGQLGTVRRMNDELRAELERAPNAWFVDLDLCVGRLGRDAFYDSRNWHVGRAPYSRSGLGAIANECLKSIRAALGKARKCLVLDCDDVLWGGLVGERGVSGIALSQTHPGSPFYEFQQTVLSLHERGVILALNSKNNEDDVWEVFRKHPVMVLREEHISAWRINWNDKVSNLRELASELNIGLDSMVFADDNEFEVEFVREALPEVEVIHLPSARASENRRVLAECGLFDTLLLSEEDRRRGEMYRAEASRNRVRAQHADLDSYLRSLGMKVEIRSADDFSIPRVAQLTQRTNQFNLTTRRYSEDDVREMAASPSCDVLAVRLKDRFGDHGLVGVAILRHEGDVSEIDSFLMSCRVIGRGVEDVLLGACIEAAGKRSASRVVASYRPMRKNVLVAEFYPTHGFELEQGEVEAVLYAWTPRCPVPRAPDHFESVEVELRNEV